MFHVYPVLWCRVPGMIDVGFQTSVGLTSTLRLLLQIPELVDRQTATCMPRTHRTKFRCSNEGFRFQCFIMVLECIPGPSASPTW